MTVSEKQDDICLEIDFVKGELKFICRSCKKENILQLKNTPVSEPLPRIGISRF
jgi:hypothetical protein